MSDQPLTYYTIEEYAAMEEAAVYKNEYIAGCINTMDVVSPTHCAIAANVGGEMGGRLKRSPYRVYNSSVRVAIVPLDVETYPDVTVVCGEPYVHPFDKNSIINPIVIFEVLSPSTEAYDRGEKWANYQRLDSLEEYVLVSQHKPQVEHYVRQESGAWLFTLTEGLDTMVTILGVSLPLAEVYDKITFPAVETLREHIHAE